MAIYSEELRRLGEHFIVGLAGATLTKHERTLLAELQPAGVIVFAHNLAGDDTWPERLHALLSEAQAAAGRDNFIRSIDHEGGKVHRLREPALRFPPARTWADRAAAVATAMGEELRALGLNLSYAPVLDIHAEPLNQVIGERAFGTTPAAVSENGETFFRALEATGIRACGKHFPGHGRTVADSHSELPVLDLPLDALENWDVIPFQHLISCGLRAIMTAHVLYPRVDAKLPATFSSAWVQSILRGQLRFDGVVITDALDMGALRGFHADNIGLRTLNAGGDLLLVAKLLPGRTRAEAPIVHAAELALELLRAMDEKAIGDTLRRDSAARLSRFLSDLLPAPTQVDLELLSSADHRAVLDSLRG